MSISELLLGTAIDAAGNLDDAASALLAAAELAQSRLNKERDERAEQLWNYPRMLLVAATYKHPAKPEPGLVARFNAAPAVDAMVAAGIAPQSPAFTMAEVYRKSVELGTVRDLGEVVYFDVGVGTEGYLAECNADVTEAVGGQVAMEAAA